MPKLTTFKSMKLPGAVYLALKNLFPFSALTYNDFNTTIQSKKSFVTIAKKRSSNECTLLNRIKNAMNGEDLESASSYFDISDFNTSFPRSNAMKQIFSI